MSDDNYNNLQKFADITIERWMKRMDALGIYETGELKRSFDAQVRLDAQGNPELVQFTYMLQCFERLLKEAEEIRKEILGN